MSESKTTQANSLYAAAEKELREKHRDEFQAILEQKYADAGLVYKRRLTAEEREVEEAAKAKAKAQSKIDALVKEFGPGILTDYLAPTNVSSESEPAVGF